MRKGCDELSPGGIVTLTTSKQALPNSEPNQGCNEPSPVGQTSPRQPKVLGETYPAHTEGRADDPSGF